MSRYPAAHLVSHEGAPEPSQRGPAPLSGPERSLEHLRNNGRSENREKRGGGGGMGRGGDVQNAEEDNGA